MADYSDNIGTLLHDEVSVLFQESTNGIVIFRRDENGVFVCRSCNLRFCEILQCEFQNLLSQPYTTIFAADEYAQLDQVFAGLLQGKTGYPVFVTLDGTQFQVHLRLLTMGANQQSLVMSFVERWRYSPSFYGNESLLNAIQDAIFIFDIDEDGHFRLNFLNQAHMDATGLDLTRDAGKTPIDLIGEEDGKKVIARYQACVDRKESILYEEKLYFPNRDQTMWWQTQLSPVEINGKVCQLVGASRNITEHKQNLEQIERLYLEYEALFNETAIPLWLVDVLDDKDVHSIRLQRYNPCYEAVYGPTNLNILGKTIEEHFIDPQKISRIYEKYEEVLRKKEPISFEYALELNGSLSYTMSTMTPILRNGSVTKIIGSSVDITALRQYQEMLKLEGEMLMSRLHQQTKVLEESFDDQDDLLTSITMDYQNPLISILGLVELMKDTTQDTDPRNLFLQQIQQQLESLLSMMNTILLDSQLSAEEVLRVQEFDVSDFLAHLKDGLVREHPSYDGRLFFENQLPMKTIWQDQQRASRILQYLINKAFERMRTDENLMVTCSYAPDLKAVLFTGLIDLSSERTIREDSDAYLQQFDDETRVILASGLDVKMIEIMLSKVGGKLSYTRDDYAARVIFTLPLIDRADALHKVP
ncbi:MAG: PAS domain S-box protein [Anaerolineae bacterium]|jgi:PAS domain S-box-containing protein|nr:PAS domain S-box protein [Anaerolineae bacterium]